MLQITDPAKVITGLVKVIVIGAVEQTFGTGAVNKS